MQGLRCRVDRHENIRDENSPQRRRGLSTGLLLDDVNIRLKEQDRIEITRLALFQDPNRNCRGDGLAGGGTGRNVSIGNVAFCRTHKKHGPA